ncbi:MAG: PilZ domain-containing protein [Planctomycetes bacterium]|nr:PilZ domain-containing protein [Planctomycetota bacterium]
MLTRRKFPRVKAGWAVEYRPVSDTEFQKSPVSGLAVDISGGGICLEAREEIAVGTMVAIDLHSPDFEAPILALAKVVWCKKRLFSDVYDVGAEFLWSGWGDSGAQAKIVEYVKQRLPPGTDAEGKAE